MEKTDEKVRTVAFRRELECTLSEGDLAKCAGELAVMGDDIVEESERIKEETKRLKDALKDMQTEEANLRRKVRRKAEQRLVECTRTFDYDRGVIIETRNDTGAQIGSEVMKDEQREIPIVLEPQPVKAEFADGSVLTLLPVNTTHGDDLADPEKQLGEQVLEVLELDEETRKDALACIRDTQRASTSSLQRRLRIGYTKAAFIMDALEREGFVGPARGSEPREILDREETRPVGAEV